ncbi:GntR family transcriptional regulator [Andreprevotia chitinilytica]|uniref:GntR family transcriptional regulator n=1 Tax=Andreprevotia chitinilytica TaxID=396808 RepID=UPI000553C4E7|nr:GntR family transcriptional regulator [Andreprevotia chitinilytica]
MLDVYGFDRKLLALAPDEVLPQAPEIQFFQKLRIAVMAGYWLPGEPLPKAEYFAQVLGVQLEHIRAALALLASQQWIRAAENDNYVITPKLDQPVAKLASFSEMLKARGFVPGSVWLSREVAAPNQDEQWRLNLEAGAKVSRLGRIRKADELVMGYEITTIPATFLPDPLLVGESLYQYMRENDLSIFRAVEEIDADLCDAELARLCQFEQGAPILRLTRVGYMQNGSPLELTYSYFRSDYYHYVVEFTE